jgi:hypothetical protein
LGARNLGSSRAPGSERIPVQQRQVKQSGMEETQKKTNLISLSLSLSLSLSQHTNSRKLRAASTLISVSLSSLEKHNPSRKQPTP